MPCTIARLRNVEKSRSRVCVSSSETMRRSSSSTMRMGADCPHRESANDDIGRAPEMISSSSLELQRSATRRCLVRRRCLLLYSSRRRRSTGSSPSSLLNRVFAQLEPKRSIAASTSIANSCLSSRPAALRVRSANANPSPPAARSNASFAWPAYAREFLAKKASTASRESRCPRAASSAAKSRRCSKVQECARAFERRSEDRTRGRIAARRCVMPAISYSHSIRDPSHCGS